MICFEVALNGKKLTRAGVSGHGVLSAILSWVRRETDSAAGLSPKEELGINISGLDTGDPKNAVQLFWAGAPVALNDVITINIIEAETADKPKIKHDERPVRKRQSRREYLKQLRARIRQLQRELEEEASSKARSPKAKPQRRSASSRK